MRQSSTASSPKVAAGTTPLTAGVVFLVLAFFVVMVALRTMEHREATASLLPTTNSAVVAQTK